MASYWSWEAPADLYFEVRLVCEMCGCNKNLCGAQWVDETGLLDLWASNLNYLTKFVSVFTSG